MTSPFSTVVLIGPMGAGKTSVGRRVAKRLGRPFFDSDIAVKLAHGPIEDIFATSGEAHFRELERAAVREGLATGGVVSLGGGAVLDAATRADLAHHRVALLTVESTIVAARVKGSLRPLLQGEDAAARWNDIYRERLPIYEELADATFDTSHGPLQDVVDAVTQWVRSTEDEENV
ncbi:shikimate kinase [Microbacterium lacus]|uniref:shikimate kinase n=1 Tax=Microbacterium lacus TaxID=415217 RepID=UPI00384ADB51